jgi:hypothetical protein
LPKIQNLQFDKEGHNTIVLQFLDNKLPKQKIIFTGKTKNGKPAKIIVTVRPQKENSEVQKQQIEKPKNITTVEL